MKLLYKLKGFIPKSLVIIFVSDFVFPTAQFKFATLFQNIFQEL